MQNSTPMFTKPARASLASAFDKKLLITQNNWVVTLLRRKNSKNPRHTFIVVEGINEAGLGILYRYDLVVNGQREDLAKILTMSRHDIPLSQVREALENLIKLSGDDDELYCRSWPLSRQQAAKLDADIEKDKEKQIRYSVLGDYSFSASKEGHSCFSWAREKINNLQDPSIVVPIMLTDYIVADPSLYLTDGTSKSCLMM